MAKLGSYYGLCPLIDHRSLLGISEDVTAGCVIVTLGKNMAVKYKLSNQKQIHSWSTKEKLSSPVIYDKKGERYVAIFNQYFIRLWKESNKNLETVKKLKFPLLLHTIIPCEDEPLVIMKNGRVFTLSYALEVRKDISETNMFDKATSIEDSTYLKLDDKIYVGMLLKNDNSYSYLWTEVECQDGNDCFSRARKIELNRLGVKMNGHLTMLTESGPTLFTLWSDGRLYSYPLNSEHSLIEPPGNFYSVIESLSRQQPVCLLALNATYIAMYGADSNKEGASLQIYNTLFKVTQSKLQLKLYTEGSKLWLVDNSILLTVGQNLAVVPFQLDTEQLAALVGSHKLVTASDDDDIAIVNEMELQSWDNTESDSVTLNSLPDISIKSQLSDLLKEGWSEVAICSEIFPKLIEKKDTKTILHSLDYFTDIPENVLVKLLSYCVSRIMETVNCTEIMNQGIPGQFGNLLDKILAVAYSDVLLLPQIRIGLKFEGALTLLHYLTYLLSENGHVLPSLEMTKSEAKIIEWGCLIFDAYYQQFLLSKDTKIIEHLKYFKALIDTYMLLLDDMKKIEPLLNNLMKTRNPSKFVQTASQKYSIERLKLY